MNGTRTKPAPLPAASAERAVLSKAVIRVAGLMEISQGLVADTLGVSRPTASRLFGGKYLLDPARKDWEMGALLVRVFRSLNSIVGSDDKARDWLNSPNLALGKRPIELLPSAEGLVRVLHYLDTARGRI